MHFLSWRSIKYHLLKKRKTHLSWDTLILSICGALRQVDWESEASLGLWRRSSQNKEVGNGTRVLEFIPVDEQILSRNNSKGNKGPYEILNAFGKQCGFPGLAAAFLSTDRQVDPERALILHSDTWREELVFLFPGDSRLTSKINKFSCKGWGGGSDSSSACHKSTSNGIQNPTPM